MLQVISGLNEYSSGERPITRRERVWEKSPEEEASVLGRGEKSISDRTHGMGEGDIPENPLGTQMGKTQPGRPLPPPPDTPALPRAEATGTSR